MAKKLSSRELAVKAKKKATMSVPKVTQKSSTPKSVAPLSGAGPLLPGQSRVANSYGGGSQLQGAGPLLPGQTRVKDSYKGGSQREMASKAKKNISTKDLRDSFKSGGLTLDDAPKTPTLSGPTTLTQGKGSGIFDILKNKASGAFDTIASGMGDMARNGSLRAPQTAFIPEEQRAQNLMSLKDNTIGVPTTNASNIPDLPTGRGDGDKIFYNDADQSRPSIFTSDFATPGTNFNRPGSEEAYNQGHSPVDYGRQVREAIGIQTAEAADDPFSGSQSPRRDNKNYSNDSQTYDNGNYSTPGQSSALDDILGQNQSASDAPIFDAPGGTVKNRSGRGSGAFGTGKGVQSDDQYIKELRKAYSSNGGEKWLRKQFDELIKALDPTYAQLQTEGTDALNSQLQNNNTQLASVMNANNTGDSEQRAQLMAGQQRDTQTAISALLSKLATAKAGDISGYKQQYATQRGQLQEKNQTNQQRLLEQIQQYQNQRSQQARQASGAARGEQNAKLSRNDVFNWAEDALNKGYSWAEIAENAKEQGIGTETGGYLDQLLNNANKQNRYR